MIKGRIPKFNISQMLLFSLVVGFFGNDFVQSHFFDARDFITVQGLPEGPFIATMDQDGNIVLGDKAKVLHPGETFGWISKACYTAGLTVQGRISLVHLPEKFELSASDRTIRPEAERCGTGIYAMKIPENAFIGDYQINRSVLLIPAGWRHWFPIHFTLPQMFLTVVPATNVTSTKQIIGQ